ncbi:MAG: DUF86 domain-containing protein [SAR202 cluster bacterium]|nr:DUF86 domain-containing protein [SAR202 cluster bacterium]
MMVHNYLGVDLEQVWDVVERDLPDVRPKFESMLRGVEGQS